MSGYGSPSEAAQHRLAGYMQGEEAAAIATLEWCVERLRKLAAKHQDVKTHDVLRAAARDIEAELNRRFPLPNPRRRKLAP